MGQIHNLAKPYIILWGKILTLPSQILYILKNPDPNPTNIFWKIHSHIQPQAIPPRQKTLFMDYLIKTFSKKIGLWQANYSQSGTFLWKPYFSYRAIWGLFTRDIPSPPSQWRRFGIPSVFFPTKIGVFSDSKREIVIFVPTHPPTIHPSQWRRFDMPSGGFFPTKIATF